MPRDLCGKPMWGGTEQCARRAGHRHRCLTREAMDYQRRMNWMQYVPKTHPRQERKERAL